MENYSYDRLGFENELKNYGNYIQKYTNFLML